jgi:hypothetical protein
MLPIWFTPSLHKLKEVESSEEWRTIHAEKFLNIINKIQYMPDNFF